MNGNKRKIDSPILNIAQRFHVGGNEMSACRFGICSGQQGQDLRLPCNIQGCGLKPIMLHKPHPGNIIKGYVMKQVYDYLKNEGLI